ncbi:MAG: SAM-dependent methyltransferase [Fulvivirga sp.]|nr:SAM-dependent methyltransferase [Fulvivirga sp.]
MSSGKLYIIPSVIAADQNDAIPEQARQVIKQTKHYLAEDLRTARRFISSLELGLNIPDLHFDKLDKNTSYREMEKLMTPAKEGKTMGLMSESGCPGVADPGSIAVQFAHANDIDVIPVTGPSSILLLLMASGFNGQQFAFHGYLPIDNKQLINKIKSLEEESRRKNQTQIFIETPYRNEKLLDILLKHAYPETHLCIGRDITGKDELIKSAPVKSWRSQNISLHKIPTVFAIYSR